MPLFALCVVSFSSYEGVRIQIVEDISDLSDDGYYANMKGFISLVVTHVKSHLLIYANYSPTLRYPTLAALTT